MIHWAWLLLALIAGVMVGWRLRASLLAAAVAENEAARDGTHPLFKLLDWARSGKHSRHVDVEWWPHDGWEVRLYESYGPGDGSRSKRFKGLTPFLAAEKAVRSELGEAS